MPFPVSIESNYTINLNGKSFKLADIYKTIADTQKITFKVYNYEEDYVTTQEPLPGWPGEYTEESFWRYYLDQTGEKKQYSLTEVMPLMFDRCVFTDNGSMTVYINDMPTHCMGSKSVELNFVAQNGTTARLVTHPVPSYLPENLLVSLKPHNHLNPGITQGILLNDFSPLNQMLYNINRRFTLIDDTNRDVRIYTWRGNDGRTYCTLHPASSLSKKLVTTALNEYLNDDRVKGNLAKGLAQNKSLGVTEAEALQLLGNLTTYVNADPNFKVSLTMEYVYDTSKSMEFIQQIHQLMQQTKVEIVR